MKDSVNKYYMKLLILMWIIGLIFLVGCQEEPSAFVESIEEKKNLTEWQLIWEDNEEYVNNYMDKDFEEIPEGDTYCETSTYYPIHCDWNKGKDEKWREYCNDGMPVYSEKCYNKTRV